MSARRPQVEIANSKRSYRLPLDQPDAIAREKAMHETTFAQPDIVDRINQRFGR